MEQTSPPNQHMHDVPRAIRVSAAWSWRLVAIGVAAAAAIWLLAAIKLIVIPVAIGLLLTVLLLPLRRALERFVRMNRMVASLVAVITLITTVGGLLVLAGSSIVDGFEDLSQKAISGFQTFITWLSDGPLHLESDQLEQYVATLQKTLSTNQDKVVSGALGAAVTAGHVVTGTIIALFCTFFFLYDGNRLWTWLIGLFPPGARYQIHQAGRRGVVTLAAYARTQVLVAAVDAIGIGLGAAILQVPLALPLSILVFVGSFIPIVGAVVTGAVAVLVALFTQGWVAALIMLGVVLAVQQLEGHVLQPFLMGQAVSLHPLAVLLAVAGGSFLAGIGGALFAVPLVAVLNTVVLYLHGHDKFPELGDGAPLTIRGVEYGPPRAEEQNRSTHHVGAAVSAEAFDNASRQPSKPITLPQWVTQIRWPGRRR